MGNGPNEHHCSQAIQGAPNQWNVRELDGRFQGYPLGGRQWPATVHQGGVLIPCEDVVLKVPVDSYFVDQEHCLFDGPLVLGGVDKCKWERFLLLPLLQCTWGISFFGGERWSFGREEKRVPTRSTISTGSMFVPTVFNYPKVTQTHTHTNKLSQSVS